MINKEFKNKDVQFVLKAEKIRVEYLSTRCGIRANIRESTGRGKANIYDFKNMFQFYIAHHLNSMGVTTRDVKEILIALEAYEETYKINIFSPQRLEYHLEIYCLKYKEEQLLAISDDRSNKAHVFLGYMANALLFNRPNSDKHLNYLYQRNPFEDNPRVIEFKIEAEDSEIFDKFLENCTVKIIVNAKLLKEELLHRMQLL